MSVPLTAAGETVVQTGLIDAAGWILLIGGIALTALWLNHLYR